MSKKFDLIVGLWLSIVLSVVLSILLPIVSIGFVNWPIFLEGFGVSFVISFVLGAVIPLNMLGGKLAAACGARPFSFPGQLISTVVSTLIMATIMSLCMVFYFLPPPARPHFIFAWLKVYPYALASIYLSSLIFAPVGVAMAKKICKVPAGVPQET